MKQLATVLALLLFYFSLSGQQASATVEGIVTLIGNTDPVPNVQISFAPEKGLPRIATTDRDGRFSVNELPPGRYVISLKRSGFVRPRRSAGPMNLSIAAGERIKGLNFKMIRAGVISGRITDENRQALRGVSVEAFRYAGKEPGTPQVAGGGGRTDDRGEYRIANVEPGEYYVRVERDPDDDFSTTYYPGVVSSAKALRVPVTAGSEAGGINFSPDSRNHYTIRVRPVVPAGWPASRTVEIRLLPKDTDIEESWVLFRSIGNGVYESYPVRGAFVLNAVAQDGQRKAFGQIDVDVANKNVNVGNLTLRPGFQLRGRVTARDIRMDPDDMSRINIAFSAEQETPWTFSPDAVLAGLDGTFLIPSVTNGRFRVSVSSVPENAYLEAVRFNGRDILDDALTIVGEPRGELDLIFAGPPGAIQGIVQNATGQPVPDATVVIVPALQRRDNVDLFKSASTDQNGAFIIRGISPGEYSVLAWEDVDRGAWLSPAFLREFEGRGQKLTIGRGSQESYTLRAIPGN
jgi:hypothetical protein